MTDPAADFLSVMDAAPLVQRLYPLVTAADIRDLIYRGLIPYRTESQRRPDGALKGGRGKYAVDLDAVLAHFAEHYEELAEQRTTILTARQKRKPAEGMPRALNHADERKSIVLADAHNARVVELKRERLKARNEAIRARVHNHPYLTRRK